MVIEEIVRLDEEEHKEAILDYVNKHKKSNYSEIKGFVFTNGSVEEKVCFTGLKFEVM